MKRLAAIFLLIALLTSLCGCGAPVVMEEGECGKYAAWTLDSDGVLTITGRDAMSDFRIEGAPWYQSRDKIKSVVVGDGITYLGAYSFWGCEKLTSVSLAASVTRTGSMVFSGCVRLETVDGSEHLTVLGDNSFESCPALEEFALSENLTVVGRCAFFGCTGIASLSFPESLTTVGALAFSGWTEAQSVTFACLRPGHSWDSAWQQGCSAVVTFEG